MTRPISTQALHRPEPLHCDDGVEAAVRKVLEAELPALPVVDADGAYAGIFGEREFMEALFPGYLKQLKGAAFLHRSLDDAIERNETCRAEPVSKYMNQEHVEVDGDFSDTHVAEVFLHHRVLVVPVVVDGKVEGVLTRRDFFRTLAERFLDA